MVVSGHLHLTVVQVTRMREGLPTVTSAFPKQVGFGVYMNPGKAAFFKRVHAEKRFCKCVVSVFAVSVKTAVLCKRNTTYVYVFRETRLRVTGASCAIFRTGMWVTHGVLAGHLVPTDTLLVTPFWPFALKLFH